MSQVTSTDLYEVTMALSYLREDMRAPATFSLFVRDLPQERGFLVAAGLAPALDYLAHFLVGRSDVLSALTTVVRHRIEARTQAGQ